MYSLIEYTLITHKYYKGVANRKEITMATNPKKDWNEIYAEQLELSQRRLAEYNATLPSNRMLPSDTVYVSNDELGQPTYREMLMSTDAKIIRERMRVMKVGEWAYFPEMKFIDRKSNGLERKERAKNKAYASNEIRRIAKRLGFTVTIRFARTKGSMLTPSVTITGERGS